MQTIGTFNIQTDIIIISFSAERPAILQDLEQSTDQRGLKRKLGEVSDIQPGPSKVNIERDLEPYAGINCFHILFSNNNTDETKGFLFFFKIINFIVQIHNNKFCPQKHT